MASESTLHDAFVDELKDLYNAEKQLTRALPKMAKAATSPSLARAFKAHLEETRGHVDRLERVFDSLGERARGKTCEGIAGILEEGKTLMAEDFDDAAMDASLIAAARRVEHYEIAAYGAVAAWAEAMGHGVAARLLHSTLAEEEAADERLSRLAEGGINRQAAAGAHNGDETGASAARTSRWRRGAKAPSRR
jgi:ferritin-like metal-binding protein YciE